MNHHVIDLLRKSHGLTVAELGARANITREPLSAILAGTKKPNTRETRGLAKTFNLALEDFGTLPTPQLDAMPDWKDLAERLYRHGARYGWTSVESYLVVMVNAWGREEARVKMMERKAQ